ncbi:MAG TPA: aspartate--tRNA(Asn) ligase [Candidatus Pacearchaeota archaeon]|nr:aspartate--tRNA(Asn) ligase [Candidatus Pacearchaeota archaeon]HOK94096.1 aspartate--tRNA(Asn) ligase [Candidatus Pacearchaeota archaeon]HPO75224.1 aspartate--tRNA(Asn) ligase [Candidatus Pacearchaeota archaeon]
MKRVLSKNAPKFLGKKIKVCGWVNSRRDHGKIVFLDLRDKTGILQVVSEANLVEGLRDEYVLEVEGEIKKRPEKMINPELETGKVELEAEKIKVLSKAAKLPFDLQKLNCALPKVLDYRPITLRNRKIQAIFKVQEEIISSFREALKNLDFTEFQAPAIVPSATEGGAEVFQIDYFQNKAYLAQSPQLYKQILVAVFEKVFTVTKAYRAEPSITTRHLTEYISLDAEMGFIESWEDLMDVCELTIKRIFSNVEKNCQKELKIHNASVPKIEKKIPRLKMREAQEIIFQRTQRDHREEMDLDPEDEKEICQFAKEKYNSDLIFITHYPTKKRPFYTHPDPEDPNYTLSFDLLFRGLEIVTGGQRIHQYKKLVENIKKWGNKPEDFEFYLQAFKYGMPPEGGFCLGAERITKQLLGLENIREASLFPRDMSRIDKRITK